MKPTAEPPDADYERRELRALLEQAMAKIPDRYADAIRLRFGLDGGGHRIAEIARLHSISVERSRQIQLEVLRRLARSRALREYWRENFREPPPRMREGRYATTM